MMIQTFGDAIDEPPRYKEYLILEFSPSTAPLSQIWRNNGVSADFMADYLTTFFEKDWARQKQIKETVSYIANELLENAMKFYDKTSHCSIRVQLYWCSDCLLFFVTNSIPSQTVAAFQTYLQVLTSTDPEELWMEKLTNNLDQDDQTQPGLGLLTMLVHHEAKLRWKFETLKTDPNVIIVTTVVQLTI
jgi:hypothetical protein